MRVIATLCSAPCPQHPGWRRRCCQCNPRAAHPRVLGWIDLWAIGRQQHQTHILWNLKFLGNVPARLVHHHDDVLIGMALCNAGQEHGHGARVHPRHNQTIHHAIVRTDRRKGVAEFTQEPSADYRTHSGRCSAPSGLAQKTKPPLVLKHQPNAAALFSLATNLLAHQRAEFF